MLERLEELGGIEWLCEQIADGHSLRDIAAADLDCSRYMLQRWIHADPDREARYDEASRESAGENRQLPQFRPSHSQLDTIFCRCGRLPGPSLPYRSSRGAGACTRARPRGAGLVLDQGPPGRACHPRRPRPRRVDQPKPLAVT